MALALVKLIKKRGDREYSFLDYISADIAKLNVQIQGDSHSGDEWSDIKVLRIFDNGKR